MERSYTKEQIRQGETLRYFEENTQEHCCNQDWVRSLDPAPLPCEICGYEDIAIIHGWFPKSGDWDETGYWHDAAVRSMKNTWHVFCPKCNLQCNCEGDTPIAAIHTWNGGRTE